MLGSGVNHSCTCWTWPQHFKEALVVTVVFMCKSRITEADEVGGDTWEATTSDNMRSDACASLPGKTITGRVDLWAEMSASEVLFSDMVAKRWHAICQCFSHALIVVL